MPISKTINLFILIFTSTIFVGCNECNSFAPTRYYSKFSMEQMRVAESDWRFTVGLRSEEACPETALRGKYSVGLSGVFRGGTNPDFPLFEQDLDVDSVFVEVLEGNLKETLTLQEAKSFFLLRVPSGAGSNLSFNVDEPSSGCFFLTRLNGSGRVASAIVQFPGCESNNSDTVYAVMGSGENEKLLTIDDLHTLYDDHVGVRTTLSFSDVDIPREFTQIRLKFVAKIVNHFTSEVIDVIPVDVILDRDDISYEKEP